MCYSRSPLPGALEEGEVGLLSLSEPSWGPQKGVINQEPKRTQRAQILKKIKIALRDWNFQARLKRMKFKARLKISSEPPTKPLFCGDFSRSRLKISSEIEVFKRDWKFQASHLKFSSVQARLMFFKIRALWETPKQKNRTNSAKDFSEQFGGTTL